MASERVQRQIDRLLDEAENAIGHGDWETARDTAHRVLTIDPGNDDAQAFLGIAERGLGSGSQPTLPAVSPPAVAPSSQPTYFANGRYQVKEFLGEGGKKRVYLAHDSVLDRDIALAALVRKSDRRAQVALGVAGGDQRQTQAQRKHTARSCRHHIISPVG